MKTYNDLTPAKLRANLLEYWRAFELWFRRRWLGLAALSVVVWLVMNKDISINFSMEKGADSFVTQTSSSLFYDPFEGEGESPAQNVSMGGNRDNESSLSPEQLAKRRKQQAYVREYARLAAAEMKTHRIPASITLAQGLLESNIGQSRLATENNNHFGIKCFSKTCSKGHCTNFNDDHHKDFFRKFGSVSESYTAHSQVLQKDRYRGLFKLKITDYRGWARGLKKAGYATDPRYADKLIRIIEDLELYQYDI